MTPKEPRIKRPGRIRTTRIGKDPDQFSAYLEANGKRTAPLYEGPPGEGRSIVVRKAKKKLNGSWMRKDIVEVLQSVPVPELPNDGQPWPAGYVPQEPDDTAKINEEFSSISPLPS